MRSWQYQGFTPAANAILSEKVEIGIKTFTTVFHDDRPDLVGSEPVYEKAYTEEVYKTENPWYDSNHDLHILRFSDGRVLETYVQAEPWSSGPCTFMAIRDHVTKEPVVETLWSQRDIDTA
jgi:hypothetical protein